MVRYTLFEIFGKEVGKGWWPFFKNAPNWRHCRRLVSFFICIGDLGVKDFDDLHCILRGDVRHLPGSAGRPGSSRCSAHRRSRGRVSFAYRNLLRVETLIVRKKGCGCFTGRDFFDDRPLSRAICRTHMK